MGFYSQFHWEFPFVPLKLPFCWEIYIRNRIKPYCRALSCLNFQRQSIPEISVWLICWPRGWTHFKESICQSGGTLTQNKESICQSEGTLVVLSVLPMWAPSVGNRQTQHGQRYCFGLNHNILSFFSYFHCKHFHPTQKLQLQTLSVAKIRIFL